MSHRKHRFAPWGLLLLPCFHSGCIDGPFFHLKKINPYIQRQWQADREKVTVFSERIDELRLLRNQIASMPPQEQSEWISKLDGILKIQHRPEALAALTPLSKDKNEKVRMALVAALRQSKDQLATNTLMAMSSSDPSNNVKLSATRALGSHQSEEVKLFLGDKLEDRNIAMRFQASQALGELTGKRYGGDIDAWRQYIAGQEVPEPKASFAKSLESMLMIR
jgi:hypothetical protein